ncbi:MAG: LptE family protein [Bacteroidales bacterium]|nr:LptE family protein [Bacteroidales bacterium]
MKICTASNPLRRVVLWLAAGAALLAACSGGYSFTGASIPPNAKTICIKDFPNYASTVNPTLSQQLSDELRNMFQSQTSLVVTNDGGDMDLSGEITAYGTRASTVSSTDEVATNRLSITIRVKFINDADPDASFEASFTRYRDYNAQLDLSAVESGLVNEIVTELCEDVFNKAVVNW